MLLDTCIVIDVLRGREPAIDFVGSLAQAPSVSAVTATELIAGARNAGERRQIERLLALWQVHAIELETAVLAGDYVRTYGPSHGVDPLDALIAATARTKELAFATLNLKHFPMFEALWRPYAV